MSSTASTSRSKSAAFRATPSAPYPLRRSGVVRADAVSALQLTRQAIDIYLSRDRNRIDYVLKGKIGGPAFSSVRFESKGELTLPGGTAEPA
jgi:hypothetical protein